VLTNFVSLCHILSLCAIFQAACAAVIWTQVNAWRRAELCDCSEVHFHTSQQPNGRAFNLAASLRGFDLADAEFATHQALAHGVFSGFCDFVFQRLFNLTFRNPASYI
jgi:hypothetical protein